MGYLGDDAPEVLPDRDDAPFWEAANDRRLVLQHCADCGRPCHPPRPLCPACHSPRRRWAAAPETGAVFSFTWSHVAPPGVPADRLPYNIALVAPTGLDDLRLISNVMDATPATLRIGTAVRLAWDRTAGGRWLPRYRLAGGRE